jgi:hypothetical protein
MDRNFEKRWGEILSKGDGVALPDGEFKGTSVVCFLVAALPYSATSLKRV